MNTFNVTLKLLINGYEKQTVHTVAAQHPLHAGKLALEAECHSVPEWMDSCCQSCYDDDMAYYVVNVKEVYCQTPPSVSSGFPATTTFRGGRRAHTVGDFFPFQVMGLGNPFDDSFRWCVVNHKGIITDKFVSCPRAHSIAAYRYSVWSAS